MQVPGITEFSNSGCCLESSVMRREELKSLDENRSIAHLDFDKVGIATVRFWRNGDRIKPLGMAGHRLLSDIFVDHKIPEFDRRTIPLVFSGRNIAWIGGVMISDDFKVDRDTKTILRIALCER